MSYNYAKDTMTVGGKRYPLSEYRKWLKSNHYHLVQGSFIKAITIAGSTKFTFDWQHIYFIAEQHGLLAEFIQQYDNQ